MRSDMLNEVIAAYGSLENPSFWFVNERAKAGMHTGLREQVGRMFVASDQGLQGNNVCIDLLVRPIGASEKWRWRVLLSYVGNYGAAEQRDGSDRDLPILQGQDQEEKRLLDLLRGNGIELLSRDVLTEKVDFRPADRVSGDEFNVYNILFWTYLG